MTLPLDMTKYAAVPVSIIICKPIRNTDGSLRDYRVIFGNEPFKRLTGKTDFVGALVSELIDNRKFIKTQLEDVPEPYVGFAVINISEDEKKISRKQFLKTIRQLEGAAILLREKTYAQFEAVFVSKGFAKLMQCNTEEVLRILNRDGIIGFTHADDRLAVKRMLRRRTSEDSTKDLTIRQVTAKGEIIWCNVNHTFIDDFGEHYVYCTFFDVTAVNVYAQRLQSTYMSIGDNFYRANERTLSMLRANLTKNKVEDVQGRDLFGTDSVIRPYSELIKLRAKNYPIEEEQKLFVEMFDAENIKARFVRGETRLSIYLFSRRRDGHYCYVNYRAVFTRHPISNDIIIALLDKILARQFDMVAYLVNDKYSVAVGDASLIGKGSIFPVTREGRYEEYLKNQVQPVMTEDTRLEALSLKTIRNELKNSEPYVVNITCKIGGEIFYKRFAFYTIDPRADFFILLKSDTTAIQRKQIEQNERLREALTVAKQANVAKTAFLSRMSHEIRTPMNAIIGLDNIALHDKNLTPTLKGHLEKIGTSARYLLTIINDILDMSRIESGRMTLRNEEFYFTSFVYQINSLIDEQCKDKGLTYNCEISSDIGKYYIGDDAKLEQVLLNILGNAVKFTERGGTVTLKIECTSQFDGQSNFRFTIKDTGIGIDEKYLPRIFEAFSQEDDTTTSRYGGSGLGLAITKNIIDIMNGTIEVTSEKGVGTEFVVNIPLKDSVRSEPGETCEMRPQDFKVLIIDDEELAREHAKSVLEEVGIEADTSSGSAEALEQIKLRHARREDYNLILVDWLLPEKDGIELTRDIRELLGEETAVIILTAYDWYEVEDKAKSAGVDTFIAKPLSSSNVLYQKLLPEKKTADLEGRRILVAEDMPVNAEIMMMILEMRGMESDLAENGQIAVEKFAASPEKYYDAVLMDIRMPVMDGLEATAAIRKLNHPDAKRVPIIAMTANAFDEDVQRSLKAGMNAHLTKPADPEHLYKTLEELISD